MDTAYLPSSFGIIISDYQTSYRFIYSHGDGITVPKSEFGKFDSIRFVHALEYATKQYERIYTLSNVLSAGAWWDDEQVMHLYEAIHGYSPFYNMNFDCEPFNSIYGYWCGSREIPLEYRKSRQKTKPTRKPNPGYIYLVKAVTPDNHYKIGLSVNPVTRIGSMGVKLPFPIDTLHTFPTSDMAMAEKSLHNKYQSKRVDGEWFALSPEDVEDICCIQSMDFTGVQ